MRKKILFIIGSLESGGVSKSITSLLNSFDRQCYDTHLLIINGKNSIFQEYLPKDITIHTDKRLEYLTSKFPGIILLVKNGHFFLAIGSICRIFLSKINKSWAGLLLSKLMPAINEKFDTIIDYNGQAQLYYMMDKLNAQKKITFFHSDYSKWPYYYSIDKKYYPKVDKIFTISETCVNSLRKYFPDCSDKIEMMENISSPTLIAKLAEAEINISKKNDEYMLITVGHISQLKGTDMAIDTAKILKGKKIKFKWMFIGKIVVPHLVKYAKENDVMDTIQFLGVKPNPYPYIKCADIFVHPSRFEGKSIALDEAKILCKPIVVTNFSTVKDQFIDHVNGSICNMTPDALADSIIELMQNLNLQNKYIDYLGSNIHDNSDEVKKLYSMIENYSK